MVFQVETNGFQLSNHWFRCSRHCRSNGFSVFTVMLSTDTFIYPQLVHNLSTELSTKYKKKNTAPKGHVCQIFRPCNLPTRHLSLTLFTGQQLIAAVK